MSVIRFPADKATPSGRRKRSEHPCSVIILPVVRIERHPGHPDGAPTPRQRRATRAIMRRRYERAKRDAEAT